MSNPFNIEIVKFGVVGAIGVCIDFFVTWLFKEKFKLNKYIANGIGFCAAVINNFLLNRYWTFTVDNQSMGEQFLKFALIALLGLAINTFLLYMLGKYLKFNFYVLKLIVIGIVFLWNFFMNSIYTFQ